MEERENWNTCTSFQPDGDFCQHQEKSDQVQTTEQKKSATKDDEGQFYKHS